MGDMRADLMQRLCDHTEWLIGQRDTWHQHADAALFTAHWDANSDSVYLHKLEIPDWAWSIANPEVYEVLRRLPDALVAHKHLMSREVIPPGFISWVVRAEVWLLSSDVEGAKQAGDTRQIHKHPDRLEACSYHAASADGVLMMATVERKSLEVNASVMKPGDPYHERSLNSNFGRSLRRASKVTEFILKERARNGG